MGKMRLCNANLPSLAGYRDERSKVLLILLGVNIAHIMDVTIANLVLGTVIPGSDNLIFVEALNDNSAMSLGFVVKGQATLDLVLAALF
jgi:hypothetical protein